MEVKPKQIKVVLIGDAGVGKTSLLEQFQYNKLSPQQKPTIGADFVKKNLRLEDGREVSLQLWDTAGQERYQSLCRSFYRGSDCCVIVYDVSHQQSYYNCQKWLESFRNATGAQVPVVLIGNKADLQKAIKEDQAQEEWSEICQAQCQLTATDEAQVSSIFHKVAKIAAQYQGEPQTNTLENYRTVTADNLKRPIGLNLMPAEKGVHKEDSCC